MIAERDFAILMDDGLKLRADIFRPEDGKPAPVIMVQGPYGKGVEYKTGFAHQWEWLIKNHPDILPGSTKSFMTWETVDPEIWTKQWGYVCIRIDSRGTGRTGGFLNPYCAREIKDFYDAIEWAGSQSWSNGKVGLLGISYYAISQWLVASLQPPSLAAIIPWEGAADSYRDITHHGGIPSNTFMDSWYQRQIITNQHGNKDGHTDPWTKEKATGPEEFSKETLLANQYAPVDGVFAHPLDDSYHRERSAVFSNIKVPFLSAANIGGHALHARGNFEAFSHAASSQKWLEIHPGRHEEWFYLQKPMEMQRRFMDHFLKEVDNGWDREPPVLLHVRRPFSTEFELRKESAWPLASTKWTEMHFDASSKGISWDPAKAESSTSFEALGEPLTIMSPPLQQETEITGPLAARIFISSSTSDADLFITLQAFSPEGKEVEFVGALDPHTALSKGWLRASHRKLDDALSLPYRPYHTHDEEQPLEPGKIYELLVEIWPTCIILPAGFRIALVIGGRDFERSSSSGSKGLALSGSGRGSGPFLHTQRPTDVFGGKTTIYTGGAMDSHVLLPIIQN